MAGPLIRVEVHEDTETLITTVSRDVDGDYYELPEVLVVAFEAARDKFELAAAAISKYIEDNGLELTEED